MNAIQWMVRTPDPKRFMVDNKTRITDGVTESRYRTRQVVSHLGGGITFDHEDWRQARGLTSTDAARREIKEALTHQCIVRHAPPGRHKATIYRVTL